MAHDCLHKKAVEAFQNKPFSEAIDAVIAVALEEAARVALEQRCEQNTPWDNACLDIAAAIRSIIKKGN